MAAIISAHQGDNGPDGGGRRRVLIVAQLDGYANGVKPAAIERFLRDQGHDVTVADTYYLSRASTDHRSPLRKLPRPGLRRLAIYAGELASVLTRQSAIGRRHLSYYFLSAELWLRRSLLHSLLRLDDYDLVVVEHPHDAALLMTKSSARTFYDCPTPWADELYSEGRLTERQRDRLRQFETAIYERVDGLSFSWQSFADYAADHYGASLKNLKQLNWGCTPVAEHERARFVSPPRIAYLGSLSSRFIDLPLMSRLSRRYPIDVYGGPPPPAELGLHYRGWSQPSVLSGYQFGLITLATDELNRRRVSAKYLHYISYGLPVLVPAWTHDLESLRGSVPYDESTFGAVVDRVADEAEWRRLSDEAYGEAQRLTWSNTLRPLDALLRQ